MTTWTMLCLFAILIVLPGAEANVNVDTPVGFADVENGHQSCNPDIMGNCVATVSTDHHDAGGMEVDAEQRIHHVIISTDFATVKDPAEDYWYVPEEAVTVYGEDGYVHHPVFEIVQPAWGEGPESLEDSPYRLTMRTDNVTLYYFGPTTKDPTAAPENREYNLTWNNDTFCYSHCGPFPTMYWERESDRTLSEWWFACRLALVECPAQSAYLNETVRGSTPDVKFGAQLYEVTIATDPAATHVHERRQQNTAALAVRGFSHAGDANASHKGLRQHGRASDDSTPPLQEPQSFPNGRPDEAHAEGPLASQEARHDSSAPPWWGGIAIASTVVASLGFLAWRLYSRFTSKDDLLVSENRNKILRFVLEKPGVSLIELAEQMALGQGTILYHMRYLERAGLARVVVMERRRYAYPVGVKIEPPQEVRETPVERLRAYLEAHLDGATRGDLRAAFPDLAPWRRNDAILRLLKTGAIEQQGGRFHIRPASSP